MKYEFEIAGIYLSSIVPTASAGLIATALLHRLLAKLGVYRRVWHPALFDMAAFVILWDAVVVLSRS